MPCSVQLSMESWHLDYIRSSRVVFSHFHTKTISGPSIIRFFFLYVNIAVLVKHYEVKPGRSSHVNQNDSSTFSFLNNSKIEMRISAIPIFTALCLSFQKEESFAFHWTTNLHRKTRKSPSRFHLFSINTRIQNMRLQPRRSRIDGGSEGRVRTSRSSSVSIDDGSAEDFKQQPSASFNWWGKDPRNRSVSGILIGGSKKD